jgi:hypothetical protein
MSPWPSVLAECHDSGGAVNLEQASDESEVQTLLPQLNGMMQLLRIKGPPLSAGHTPTTRQHRWHARAKGFKIRIQLLTSWNFPIRSGRLPFYGLPWGFHYCSWHCDQLQSFQLDLSESQHYWAMPRGNRLTLAFIFAIHSLALSSFQPEQPN